MQFRSFYIVTIFLPFLFGCHLQNGAVHRVEEGETLIQISHIYGVSLKEILAANHLPNPNELKPGEKIFVPNAIRSSSQVNLENLDEMVENGEVPASSSKPTPTPKETPVAKKTASPREERTHGSKMSVIWPANGKVIWPFGMRREKMHNGIDIKVEPKGPIRASLDGEVAYRGRGVAGYGDLIILKHPGHLFTVYAYLGEIEVEKGKSIRQGDVIARAQPDASSSFFHFEIRRGKTALDPAKLLPSRS